MTTRRSKVLRFEKGSSVAVGELHSFEQRYVIRMAKVVDVLTGILPFDYRIQFSDDGSTTAVLDEQVAPWRDEYTKKP